MSNCFTEHTSINPPEKNKLSFAMFVVLGLIVVYIGRIQEVIPFLSPLRVGLIFQLLAVPVVFRQFSDQTVPFVDTKTPEVRLLLLLFCWGIASAVFSQFLRASVTFMFVSFSRNLMFFLLIVSVTKTEKNLLRLVWCYILSISILAVPALLQQSGGRWVSLDASYDSNDLALLFVVTLPFVIHLIPRTKGAMKIVPILLVPVLLNALVATGSRGGFLGLVTVLLILLLRSQITFIKKALIILISVVAFINFAPSSFQNRISAIGLEDYNTSDNFGRILIWERSLELLAHHPLFGVGPGSFAIANGFTYANEVGGAAWNMTTHNSFLLITVEMGVIGGLLYMAFIIKSLKRVYEIQKLNDSQQIWLAKALEASLAGFLVSGFFLSFCYQPISYFLVALGLVFFRPRYSVKEIALSGC